MTSAHRIRKWTESRTLPKNEEKGRKQPKRVQVFLWECWGPNCVHDGKPIRGSETMFQSKQSEEIAHHKGDY